MFARNYQIIICSPKLKINIVSSFPIKRGALDLHENGSGDLGLVSLVSMTKFMLDSLEQAYALKFELPFRPCCLNWGGKSKTTRTPC